MLKFAPSHTPYEKCFNQSPNITTLLWGEIIKFNSISNPNNPNARFKTLKPGSISLYDKETGINVDASDFNFDSSQFADLLDAIQTEYAWEISY